MRYQVLMMCLVLGLTACDPHRIYDQNFDFSNQYWPVDEKPAFEFLIAETEAKYNLYVNVRNTISYPNANLYFTYQLSDSTGTTIEQNLISELLFDRKTGKPFGSSVLGDIYDHRFLILSDYTFRQPGKYTIQFEQFMRKDTLDGVLALGLRVEQYPAAQ